MFIPCPHCGFLVALILPTATAGSDGAAQRCPRCEGDLRVDPAQAEGAIDHDHASGAQPDPPRVGGDLHSAGTSVSEPIYERSAQDRDASPTDRRDDAIDASVPAVAPALPALPDGSNAPAAPDPAIEASAATAKANTKDRGARATTGDHALPTTATPAAPAARSRRSPSFVRGKAAAPRTRLAWPWHAAIVLLGLALMLQLLLAQRHELAASARWRPWVAGLCEALPCTIPPWREPQAFTMLERSVQPHDAMPRVLAVQASFRNDARWPQAWPTLLLSLSDVEGRQVGLRAFAPSEYRDAGAAADDLLAPGQGATVRLQVREPAPHIVAFTFDFQ